MTDGIYWDIFVAGYAVLFVGVFFLMDWKVMSSPVLIMCVLVAFIPGLNMLMAIAFAGALLLRAFDRDLF